MSFLSMYSILAEASNDRILYFCLLKGEKKEALIFQNFYNINIYTQANHTTYRLCI